MTQATAKVAFWGCALCFSAAMQPAEGKIFRSWDGGSSNWTDGAHWSSGDYPNNGHPNPGDTYHATISSGMVNRNAPITITDLNFYGGTLAGSSTLTVTGSSFWEGGTIQTGSLISTGFFDVTGNRHLNNAHLTLGGSSSVFLDGADALTLDNQSTLTNSTTLRVRGDTGIYQGGAGSSTFANSGTFSRETGTGTFMIGTSYFTNSGTVNANSGTLLLSHGITNSGAIHIDSGAVLRTDGASDFNAGTSFSGSGQWLIHDQAQAFFTSVVIPNTVSLEANGSIMVQAGRTLTLNGAFDFAGQLTGGGAVTANGALSVSSGTITGGTLTLASGEVATHGPSAPGGTITLNNGGLFRNEGNFDAQNNGGFASGTGSNNRFDNAGRFTRNTSSGVYTIATVFNNTHIVDVSTGTLRLSGGGTSTGGVFDINASAKIEVAGDYTFAAGNMTVGLGLFVFGTEAANQVMATHSITADMTADTQVMLGKATVNIAPTKTFTATSSFNALLGGVTGGGTFLANGGSAIGNLTINGATLRLGSGPDHSHASAAAVVLTNGGILTNAGHFFAQGDHDYAALGDLGIAPGVGTANAVNNSGTFTRNTGTGTYAVGVPINNTGTVSSQSGALIFDHGGTSTDGTWDTNGGLLQLLGDFTFNGTTTLSGPGTFQLSAGTHTVNGPINAAAGLAIYGPGNLAVQPAQTVTVGGLLSLLPNAVAPNEPPTLSAGGIVLANGGIDLQTVIINGTTLTNAATQSATHATALPVTLQNGGVIQNPGIWLALGDATIAADASLTNAFHNSGVFTRNTSAGIYTVAAPFENTGIVNGVTGTLAFTKAVTTTGGSFDTTAGAVISFAADSSFDAAGVFTGGGEVQFNGGTQTFVQSTASGAGLTLTTGKLALPVGVVLDSNGIFHPAGGEITGPGTLNANAGFNLTGSLALTGMTLNLALGQTAAQTDLGTLTLNGAVTVNNLGTFHAQNDGSISPGTGPGFAFNNSGTLIRDTGTGVFGMAVPFHNSGTLEVQTGTFSFSGGGTSTGIYRVAADADLSLTGNTEFSGASAFTGAGRINLQNGTQTISDSMASEAIVNLSGGVLSIATVQTFESAGTFRWSGGSVTGGGTLENTGNLNTTGAAILNGATLRTTATSVSSIESAGSLVLRNGAILNNEGTFFLLNSGAIAKDDASPVAFANTGTVSRDTGTGVFSIQVPFNHSGIVNLNSGTLGLYGGGTAANSVFHTQSGTILDVGSNYTFGANNVITGSGAAHFSSGSLHVTGSLTSDGSFNWTGGTLDGGGVFTVKGGLSITPGAGGVYINGSILENAVGSEAVISGASATHIVNGGTYRNAGLTRLQGNNNFSDDGGGANSIVNSGTLIRDAGAGNYTITLPIHNTGTIRSSSGALLLNAGGTASAGVLEANGGDIYLNGGNYGFSGGVLSGSSFVYLTAGTALVTEDTGATSGPATGGFGIAGGSFGGTAMLSVERGYFSTGTMTDTAVLRLTGASSKVNNTHFTMSGSTIQNDGTFVQAIEANWDLDNSDVAGGGTILNNGTWTLNGTSSFSNTYGGGSFDNAGTFHQAVGYNWMRPAFHNRTTGVVNSNAGYILLAGGGSQAPGSVLNADGGDIYFYGGTHQLDGGTFTGSNFTYASLGTVSVNANVGAASGAATGGFGVSGATITGTGMLSAERGYFSTGQISGEVVLRFTGASSKAINSHLVMSGGTIQNDGTYTQGVEANWDLDNSDTAGGGTIQNNGTWTLTSGSSFSNTYGGGAFNNPGILNQSGGNNYVYAAFYNTPTGKLNATADAIHLMGGGTHAAGSVLNAAGGNIYFRGGTHDLNGCSLIGDNYAYAMNGTVNINQNVNATTGPATGGFAIYSYGGTAYVSGTAMLSVDHGYLSSGTITGSPTLRFTGNSSKEANSYLSMTGGIIRNEGTFTHGYGSYDLDGSNAAGGGTIQNIGTWNLNDSNYFSNTYGGGSIINPGVFNFLGGASFFYAGFHNQSTGIVNASGGNVYFIGNSTHAAGSILNTGAASAIVFQSGTHELDGATLTGNGWAYAYSGTLNVTGDVNATSGPATGGFALYSYNGNASLGGSAMLSVERGYFSSGVITGDVVLRLTGESSTASNSSVTFYGGTIRNEGAFTQGGSYASYDLDGSSDTGGGTLVNTGIWNLNTSSNFANTYAGGVFNNSGTLNQAGGVTYIYAAFNNQATGVIHATAGSIHLSGGGEQATGSVLNADGGDIYLSGGLFTMNQAAISGSNSVYATGGTVNINENVGATTGPATGGFGVAHYSATITGTGMLSAERGYLSDGNISGSPVLRFTGASSKANYSTLSMSGGMIQNDGVFTQDYQANYELDTSSAPGGGTLQNNGTWNLTGSSNFSNTYGGGVFNNLGTLNQSGGDSYMYAAFHNAPTGVVNATAGVIRWLGGSSQAIGSVLNANGGSIYFQGGTHEWNGGTITGSTAVYAISGTVNLNGDVGAPTGAATGGFGISGYYVTVAGTGMLSAERGELGSGNMSGSPVLRFTGASSKANYSTLSMSGGMIQNDGVFTQDYQANYELDTSSAPGGGTLLNKGTWNLAGSSSFSNTYGGGAFNNPGTFNQSGGDSYMYATFQNAPTGVVNATAGIIRWLGGSSHAIGSVLNADGGSIYFQGGTHEWNGGTITGSTTVYAISGTVNLNGDVGAPTGAATGGFGISGYYATVAGTGMLSAERGELGSGNMSGSPVLRFTGASSKANYSTLAMSGGIIQNDGVFTQDYQANYELDSSSAPGGGTLLNHGTWNLTNSSSFSNSYGGGAFNNLGTLNQSGGDNYIYAAIANSGTIHASAGILRLYGGSAHTGTLITDSHILLGAGAHSLSGGAARLSGSGALSGNLSISDGAKIAPGNSPGTLTLYGHVGFVAEGAHPACAIELAGTSSFDQIAIGDSASLELGTALTDLEVTLQYAPAYGDTFRIVNAGGSGQVTGTFRNLPGTDSVMTVTYGTQSYYLGITYDGAGKHVDLTVLTPYLAWAYGKGLHAADAAFGADPDLDGIANGIEFVIGGEPNPGRPDPNSTALLPQITVDETYLRVIYRRSHDSVYLNPGVEYDADLAGPWTFAANGVGGVGIAITANGFAAGIDRVEVLIPRTHAVDGRLFARLTVAGSSL